jgi:hypothetical protein
VGHVQFLAQDGRGLGRLDEFRKGREQARTSSGAMPRALDLRNQIQKGYRYMMGRRRQHAYAVSLQTRRSQNEFLFADIYGQLIFYITCSGNIEGI